jgi:1D-myo-inositol 3-kinase
MTAIAAIGHLTRDVVADSAPRPGGTVFYSARALARIGAAAHIAASCAAADRAELVPPLEAFGLPVTWHESATTTAYRLRYARSGRRIMRQEAVGDPWPPERALEAARDARWIHVGALTRTDFPRKTLRALAAGRTLLVDAQGLVRTPAVGPLRRNDEIGDVLRYATILKLDEEEAGILVGDTNARRLQTLGVPEVLLTRGARGSVVVTPAAIETVPALDIARDVDPTGAGDMFAAVYLAARVRGAEPAEAARSATETVVDLLAETPA